MISQTVPLVQSFSIKSHLFLTHSHAHTRTASNFTDGHDACMCSKFENTCKTAAAAICSPAHRERGHSQLRGADQALDARAFGVPLKM